MGDVEAARAKSVSQCFSSLIECGFGDALQMLVGNCLWTNWFFHQSNHSALNLWWWNEYMRGHREEVFRLEISLQQNAKDAVDL